MLLSSIIGAPEIDHGNRAVRVESPGNALGDDGADRITAEAATAAAIGAPAEQRQQNRSSGLAIGCRELTLPCFGGRQACAPAPHP